MFSGCESLISLPDISKWNINKGIDMFGIFDGCSSLISLPDISKWNTNIVTDMIDISNEYTFSLSLKKYLKFDFGYNIDEHYMNTNFQKYLNRKEKIKKFDSNIESTKPINNKNDNNKNDVYKLQLFNEKEKYIKTKLLKQNPKKEINRGDIHILKMN